MTIDVTCGIFAWSPEYGDGWQGGNFLVNDGVEVDRVDFAKEGVHVRESRGCRHGIERVLRVWGY